MSGGRTIMYELRLTWLMQNKSTWEKYQFGPRSDSKRILFEMLQTAGLYAPTTNWFDAGIEGLVIQARKLIAVGQTEYNPHPALFDALR